MDGLLPSLVGGPASDDGMDRLGRARDALAFVEHVALHAGDVPAVMAGGLFGPLQRPQGELLPPPLLSGDSPHDKWRAHAGPARRAGGFWGGALSVPPP